MKGEKNMTDLLKPTVDELIHHTMDITQPGDVEVAYSDKTVWINIDDICILRICRMSSLTITDLRTKEKN